LKRNLLSLLTVFLCLACLSGCARHEVTEKLGPREVKERTKEAYKFESWPIPIRDRGRAGVRIEADAIEGFTLMEPEFYSPQPGVNYTLQRTETGAVVEMTVKVCESKAEAHDELIDYFAFGTHAYLERAEDVDVGDIAFALRGFPTMAFVRDNVKVILHLKGGGEQAFRRLARIATAVDEIIQDAPVVSEQRPLMKPRILDVKLEPARARAGQKVKIEVSARPYGQEEDLYYAYRATGGTILKGKRGAVFYTPDKPGKHRVEVLVGNSYNVVASHVEVIQVN
jgi:hypothetical protein